MQIETPAGGQQEDGAISIDKVDLKYLPEGLHSRTRSILQKHTSMWVGTLGTINATELDIELQPGAIPLHQAPYRACYFYRNSADEEIKHMLNRRCNTPLYFGLGLTRRTCAQRGRYAPILRELQPIQRSQETSLSLMDVCIESLGDARYFTNLEANSGYWQLFLRAGHIDKTAFVINKGFFEYFRKPFGFRNAPAIFQRAFDIILAGHS